MATILTNLNKKKLKGKTWKRAQHREMKDQVKRYFLKKNNVGPEESKAAKVAVGWKQ